MHARKTAITLRALLLSLALAGSAHAAPTVQVTYDLANSTVASGYHPDSSFAGVFDDHVTTFLAGTMVARYSGGSGSTIQSGAASLRSLSLYWRGYWGYPTASKRPYTGYSTMGPNWTPQMPTGSGYLRLKLLSPATGTLLSGGTLSIPNGQFQLAGKAHCYIACSAFTATKYLTYSTTVALSTVASVSFQVQGPAPSLGTGTLHNVSGQNDQLPSYTRRLTSAYTPTFSDYNRALGREVKIVGSETLREPIPEPGSLLLLGSGLAGLGALGGGAGIAGRRLRRHHGRDA